jgi:hypothetical protein
MVRSKEKQPCGSVSRRPPASAATPPDVRGRARAATGKVGDDRAPHPRIQNFSMKSSVKRLVSTLALEEPADLVGHDEPVRRHRGLPSTMRSGRVKISSRRAGDDHVIPASSAVLTATRSARRRRRDGVQSAAFYTISTDTGGGSSTPLAPSMPPGRAPRRSFPSA